VTFVVHLKSWLGVSKRIELAGPGELRNKKWVSAAELLVTARIYLVRHLGEGPYPCSGAVGGRLLGNSGPPSALGRISNDQNVNVVLAGGALE